MRSPVSRYRRPLTLATVLLLITANCHCAWEWQAELHLLGVVAEHRAAGEPLPIGLPAPGCDDESGCICRGAIISHAASVDRITTSDWGWQIDFPSVVTGEWIACEPAAGRNPDCQRFAPPISGRQLRALYASLLI